jgi:hypothetical protein
MSGLIALLLGPLGRMLMLAVGALGALFAIRQRAHSAGKAEARGEIQQAQMEDTKDAIETRAEAARDVAGAPDAAVDDWLRRPAQRHAAKPGASR